VSCFRNLAEHIVTVKKRLKLVHIKTKSSRCSSSSSSMCLWIHSCRSVIILHVCRWNKVLRAWLLSIFRAAGHRLVTESCIKNRWRCSKIANTKLNTFACSSCCYVPRYMAHIPMVRLHLHCSLTNTKDYWEIGLCCWWRTVLMCVYVFTVLIEHRTLDV